MPTLTLSAAEAAVADSARTSPARTPVIAPSCLNIHFLQLPQALPSWAELGPLPDPPPHSASQTRVNALMRGRVRWGKQGTCLPHISTRQQWRKHPRSHEGPVS